MADYGIPYLGSKDKVVNRIATLFPAAENFYDLFGGGFSVSHYMLLHRSRDYKRFFYNDLTPGLAGLIQDAIAGKYNYSRFLPPWISRADFLNNKDRCAYTRIIWSFGNNQKGYLFGEPLEADKRSLHNAVVFNEFDQNAVSLLKIRTFPPHLSVRGRRLMCRALITKQNKRIDLQQLEQLEQLERLQQLERLERLQQLEQLERLERLEQLEQLELSDKSYADVSILPNSVIYCDPPYKGTAGYLSEFDHGRFWTWALGHAQPVFVSEYTAPAEARVVMALHKKTTLSSKGMTSAPSEKVYANAAALRALKIPPI